MNTRVPNPFYNYLTRDKFPGALRNNRTVTLGSLLVPYPQYTSIMQTNTNGRQLRTQMFELHAQRPFSGGLSIVAAYVWSHDRIQQSFDDLAQYQVLTTNGRQGWQWRPTDTPVHRITTAVSWELPVGRDRAFLSNMPTALDLVVGGWQYTTSARWYSGRPLLFNTSYVVDGNPRLANPTRDRWFDTSMFHLQDTYTPRSNPWYYNRLDGPGAFFSDLTLTKMFNVTSKYRIEARVEAYNVFNNVVWDNPDLSLSSANFGRVTRKRTDGEGREMQIGIRVVF